MTIPFKARFTFVFVVSLFIATIFIACGDDDADPSDTSSSVSSAATSSSSDNDANLSVNPDSKDSVERFYQTGFLPYEALNPSWTGSVANKDPGTISLKYRQATVRRVNYFRALCHLPAVDLDEAQSAKCQHAALIMSANKQLSHTPPETWECWTPEGAEAAGKSNLVLKCGPQAISVYMSDPGGNNAAVGHRRWILYPPLAKVGTGSVPFRFGYPEANALWVVGNEGTRPNTPEFVAWPAPGWFPMQHLPATEGRWSFSVNGADWSQTTISVTRDGSPANIIMEAVDNAGYGDRTIVFRPENGTANGFVGPEDVWVVKVNSVLVNGVSKNYSYTVRVFDPSPN